MTQVHDCTTGIQLDSYGQLITTVAINSILLIVHENMCCLQLSSTYKYYTLGILGW